MTKESAGTQQERSVNCGDKGDEQFDKFRDAARELEADEDEKRWEKRLRKVAKQKPDKAGRD